MRGLKNRVGRDEGVDEGRESGVGEGGRSADGAGRL